MMPTRLGCLFTIALCSTGRHAHAQSEGSFQNPTVMVLAFERTGPDCSPTTSFYGRCVERVRFAPWSPPEGPDRLRLAIANNTGRLHANLWRDMAGQWSASPDPDGLGVRNGPSWATVPPAYTWLGQDEWVDPRVAIPTRDRRKETAPGDALFPVLRVDAIPQHPDAPQVVVLRGHFATGGDAAGFDMFDGDPTASAEMLDPLMASGSPPRRLREPEPPLDHFDFRGDYTDVTFTMREDEDFGTAYDLAAEEAERFVDAVWLRLATGDVTQGRLRAAQALLDIRRPPAYSSGADPFREDSVPTRMGRRWPDSGLVAYEALPVAVVQRSLHQFGEWHNPSEDLLRALYGEIVDVLEEDLREGMRDNPDRFALQALDDTYLRQWIQNHSFPGREPIVERSLPTIALRLLISRLDPDERGSAENKLLLDHFQHEWNRAPERSPDAPPTTPAAAEELFVRVWGDLREAHRGRVPTIREDYRDLDDLRTLCGDLDEPTVRPIVLEQLVIAPGWLRTTEELLWTVREQLPFLFVDDPRFNLPTVTRLVALPEDQSIYRIQWEIWPGWHLLWGTQPIDDTSQRLTLHTAAVCEDTVLAQPEVVPTLVRAAMLYQSFRPSPYTLKAPEKRRKKRKADQVLGTSTPTIQDAAAGDAEAITEVSATNLALLRDLGGRQNRSERLNTQLIMQSTIEYVRQLVFDVLHERAAGRPTMIVVLDHRGPERLPKGATYARAKDRIVGEAPYMHARSRVSGPNWLFTTGWAWHLNRFGGQTEPIQVPPGPGRRGPR